MPRKQGSTDAQRTFLRTWIDHPEGPPADQWPDPVVFARWLKNRRFRATLNAIRDTHRYRSDLHLANASSVAAQSLDSLARSTQPADPDPVKDQNSKIENAITILRLSHLRQRFAPLDPPPPVPKAKLALQQTIHNLKDALKLLGRADPGRPVGEVCDNWIARIEDLEAQAEAEDAARKLQHHKPPLQLS